MGVAIAEKTNESLDHALRGLRACLGSAKVGIALRCWSSEICLRFVGRQRELPPFPLGLPQRDDNWAATSGIITTALRPGLPRRKQRPIEGSLVIPHISVCGTYARPSISAVCCRRFAVGFSLGHWTSLGSRSRCFRRGKPGRRAWLVYSRIGSLPVVVPLGQAQRKPFTRADTVFSQ